MFFLLSMILVSDVSASDDKGIPTIVDSDLKVEQVFRGLDFPTSIAFIGPDDILVLEKDKGTVQRITDGKMSEEPLLDVDVSHMNERGMLGIAVSKNSTINSNPYVFLYYTKSQTDDDENIFNATYGVSNYLYRYELVNNSKFLNPKLLLSTPRTTWETWHNGGYILIGSDNNVYVTIGDLTKFFNATQAQNVKNGTLPNLTGGILRITQNGEALEDDVLGNIYPLNFYYAYGIRNSFGIDFDPISGKLWDTENGPYYGDEINLVEPGFNSGWSKVQGIWKPTRDLKIGNTVLNPDSLVDFDGKGKYSVPEFIWKEPVGPTAIKFLHSDKYGKEYKDDLFVGDVNNGYLYHFDLNKDRSGLVLKGRLQDKVADTDTHDELNQIKFGEGFGEGFGGITDIEVGPYDGLLYVVSRDGAIYRIIPQGSVDKYELEDKGGEKREDSKSD